MAIDTANDSRITALRTTYNRIYGLREDGRINIYTNQPFAGMKLSKVIAFNGSIRLTIGLDIDKDGFLWSFDNKTMDLVMIHPDGYAAARIPGSSISNVCWSPTDIATTCDGLVVITDLCGNGRIFVLQPKGDRIRIVQYNDGRLLPEPPLRVSTGPEGDLFFTGVQYVTVFQRKDADSKFRMVTSWLHDLQFAKQLFADQNGRVFIASSKFSAGRCFLLFLHAK